MLFQPEAHEALADEPWSAERVRTAIASIVADAESAFDDGWPTHPQDFVEDDEVASPFVVYERLGFVVGSLLLDRASETATAGR